MIRPAIVTALLVFSSPLSVAASVGGRPSLPSDPFPRTHDLLPIPQDNNELPGPGDIFIPQPHDWNGDALPFPGNMPVPIFAPAPLPRGAVPFPTPAIRRGRRAPVRRQTIVPPRSSFWLRVMHPSPSIPR